MNPANLHEGLGQALATGSSLITNPGTGNTLDLGGMNFGLFRAPAGTYKLPDSQAERVGQMALIYATGAVAIQNAAATTRATLASGEWAIAMCVSTTDWKLHVVSGVGDDFAALLESSLPTVLPVVTGASNATLVVENTTLGSTVVGTILSNIETHILSTQGWWQGIPLGSFREVTSGGDPGDIAANGGVLASDSTPIFLGDAAEALAIQWASSNSDIIATTVGLPPNMDGAASVFVDLVVRASGTTNAPSFTLNTNFNGAAQVIDTATGAASAAIQTITATIAAADVPAAASVMSIQLVPGTHATDEWDLLGVRIRGKQTLLSS